MTTLEKLLRKERILTKFKHNLNTKKCSGAMHDVDSEWNTVQEYIDKFGETIGAISGSFVFLETPEGEMWYDIDDKLSKLFEIKKS